MKIHYIKISEEYVEAPCFIKGLFINTRNVQYIDVKMFKRKEDNDTQ